VQGRVTGGATGSEEAEDPAAGGSCVSRSGAEDPAVSDEAGDIDAVSSGGDHGGDCLAGGVAPGDSGEVCGDHTSGPTAAWGAQDCARVASGEEAAGSSSGSV
jgi:hypothetical protein